LIRCSEDAPTDVRDAAALLRCSNILLVNVAVNHPAKRQEQWIYVYDEDKVSTRNQHHGTVCAEQRATRLHGHLRRGVWLRLPPAACRPRRRRPDCSIGAHRNGRLDNEQAVLSMHVRPVPWGNVIFDHNRRPSLERTNEFLDKVGVLSAGRFAEWKYFMTHDCLLRAKRVAEQLSGSA